MDCTKKVLEAEMRESVHARYPECSTKSYVLPIIPFRKPIYKPIRGWSFPTSVTDQRVREQTKTDESTLLGSHTENLVSKCLARISESSGNDPMFVLIGYNLDNYLCGLEDRRVKETKSCVQTDGTCTETSSTEMIKGRAESIPKDKQAKNASKAGKTKNQTEDSNPQGENDPDSTRTQSAKTSTISKSQSRKKKKKITAPVTSDNHAEDCGTSQTVQKETGMIGDSKDTEPTIYHPMDTVTAKSTRPQSRHTLSQQQTSKDTSALEDSTLKAQAKEPTVNIEKEKQEKPSKKKRKKCPREEQSIQACFDELEERAKEVTPRGFFPEAQDFDLPSLCRAEYDALIISRNYGLVVIETKTMRDRENSVARDLKTESERNSYESNSKAQASETTGSNSENETQQDREQPNRNMFDHHTSFDQSQTQGSKLEVRREGSPSGSGGNKMKTMSLDETAKEDRNETKKTIHSSLKKRCELGQNPIDIPFGASSQQTDGCFVDTAFETDLTKSEGNSPNIGQQTDEKETAEDQASHEIDEKKTKRNGTTENTPVQGETLQGCFESAHQLGQTEPSRDEANDTLQTNLTQTSQDQRKDTDFETDLKKTVTKALKQLKKAGLVLKYLTSDVTQTPAVTKVLALPYVSRSRLRTTLQDNPLLVQAMCECLETDTFEEALTRCLCADETKRSLEQDKDCVSSTQDKQPEALQKWWTEMTSGIRADTDKTSTEISMDSYEEILSRFCGKYSKVEGHSVADCIHLTGVHFGRSILRQEQLDILQSKDNRFVFLSGPPGSGKTLLLGLKAVEWAKAGDVVIIVCSKGVNMGSLVSWQLYRRVKEALGWKKSEEEPANTAENGGLRVKKLEQEAKSRKTAENEVLLCNGSKVEHEQTQGISQESENSCLPKAKKKKGKKKTSPKTAPSLADNVNLEFISSETNIHDFLENVLQNYGASGQNLRFIVDEVQKEVTQESQIQRLRDGLLRLEKIQEIYLEIADQLEAKSERHANAKAQHCPQDQKTVSDQQHLQPEAKHITELFHTMKKRQGYMFHRLAKLEPKAGGLPLMDCAEWKDLMRSINIVYNETVKLRDELHETVVDGVQQGTLDKAWVKENLEKADVYMVSAMGFLYHAFNFLLFFLTDQLFSTLKNMQSTSQQRQVSVWISTIYPYYPPGFEVKRLTCCLRCPPAVQEIMSLTQNSVKYAPDCCYVSRGCESELPLPSDGLNVKWIDHAPHMTSAAEVNDCKECGKILADYLLNDLRIGQQGDPDGLTMEDVLISGSPIHQSDCRFVQELRGRGIDTQYENQELKVPPPYPNKALIMGGGTIQGLEAKIVVYVPEIRRIEQTRKDMITLTSNPQSNVHGTNPSKDQQQPDKAENANSNSQGSDGNSSASRHSDVSRSVTNASTNDISCSDTKESTNDVSCSDTKESTNDVSRGLRTKSPKDEPQCNVQATKSLLTAEKDESTESDKMNDTRDTTTQDQAMSKREVETFSTGEKCEQPANFSRALRAEVDSYSDSDNLVKVNDIDGRVMDTVTHGVRSAVGHTDKSDEDEGWVWVEATTGCTGGKMGKATDREEWADVGTPDPSHADGIPDPSHADGIPDPSHADGIPDPSHPGSFQKLGENRGNPETQTATPSDLNNFEKLGAHELGWIANSDADKSQVLIERGSTGENANLADIGKLKNLDEGEKAMSDAAVPPSDDEKLVTNPCDAETRVWADTAEPTNARKFTKQDEDEQAAQENIVQTCDAEKVQTIDDATGTVIPYLTEPSGEMFKKLNRGKEVVAVKVPAVSDPVISSTIGEGRGGIQTPSGRIEEAVAMVGTAGKANSPLGMAEGGVDASSGTASETDADKLQRLGGWNREYLWQVASRSVSHLIVFHI
ncbi:uncharacterized protein [Littorina saxatilis]|uniref:Uncharacterized protein n=1 Tax=Littorina saxatilis TaxID=31220 RepID=A0AAN9AW81_9CAEN